jgi:beta-lactamase class A
MAGMVEASDNTAANLLLAASDGPRGLTRYFRSLGDDSTRLDRNEPAMSNCELGDVRDTTTPAASVADLRVVLLGTKLSASSRDSLIGWMEGCTTGGNRLRAGLPPTWRVGDKTGSGGHGTTNDVAIVWPPGREPVVVAAYITGTSAEPQARFDALAAVGRLTGEWIAAGAPAQRR